MVQRLFELIGTRDFWTAVATSLLKVAEGFLIGLALGAAIAAGTSRSGLLRTFLAPLLECIKAVPVASFIILAVIWLSIGNVPVLTAALVVLPNVWANMESGFQNIDSGLMEMAGAFRMPWAEKVRRIVWPSVRPYFTAAVKNGMGMAWKAGIAAEVIAPYSRSVGSALHDAKIYLETTDVFAWTLVVVLLSYVLEKAVIALITKGERKNG